MRYLIILLLILFASNTLIVAQENEYNLAIEELHPLLKQYALSLNDELFPTEGNGAAILIKAKIDTIESINDFSNYEYEELELLEQNVWIATGLLYEDTFSIQIGEIFGNQFINIEVKRNETKITFEEIHEDSNNLKLNASDSPKSEMQIPIEYSNLELSKTNGFMIGDTIFGKLNMKTKPYYHKPMYFDFEKISREFEILFKFKVN